MNPDKYEKYEEVGKDNTKKQHKNKSVPKTKQALC